jgi:perosamine synthetase
MPLRTLSPAGTPIHTGEILRWLIRLRHGELEAELLRDRFRERYGVEHVFLFSSGRAAMTVALDELRRAASIPGRRSTHPPPEVLVPGYTCYSVAASIIRAGLRVRPIEIDPDTLDYDREALEAVDTRGVLAVLSANLYGIPNDLSYLEAFASARSIAMVDDAAQSLHARLDGRYSGTFGTAGIFSLDKGKNITSLQGGVLLTDDRNLASRVESVLDALRPVGAMSWTPDALKLLAYAALLHPRRYWIPHRMLKLGVTPWETDFPISRYPHQMAPVASILLDRVEDITRERVNRGAQLRDAVMASSVGGHVTLPTGPGGGRSQPVSVRLPILLPTEAARTTALRLSDEAGAGATGSYPAPLMDIPEVRRGLSPDVPDTPVARRVARTILTLPTHSYVTTEDNNRAVRILERAVEQHR